MAEEEQYRDRSTNHQCELPACNHGKGQAAHELREASDEKAKRFRHEEVHIGNVCLKLGCDSCRLMLIIPADIQGQQDSHEAEMPTLGLLSSCPGEATLPEEAQKKLDERNRPNFDEDWKHPDHHIGRILGLQSVNSLGYEPGNRWGGSSLGQSADEAKHQHDLLAVLQVRGHHCDVVLRGLPLLLAELSFLDVLQVANGMLSQEDRQGIVLRHGRKDQEQGKKGILE
mmetsp:Transcript_36985/g.86796  ORF Transcript_36985/g.86796 Transcript_36985/m.86796 type:complete len:228 (-) Transcript_36985:32-715(-)